MPERPCRDCLKPAFPREQITVVCSDETKERYFSEFEHQHPAGTYTPTATIAGGTIGALLGGLTVVASAIATGGLALWAAGPITAWAGGVAGGLVGAMMTRGVEKELANFYQQAVVAARFWSPRKITARIACKCWQRRPEGSRRRGRQAATDAGRLDGIGVDRLATAQSLNSWSQFGPVWPCRRSPFAFGRSIICTGVLPLGRKWARSLAC